MNQRTSCSRSLEVPTSFQNENFVFLCLSAKTQKYGWGKANTFRSGPFRPPVAKWSGRWSPRELGVHVCIFRSCVAVLGVSLCVFTCVQVSADLCSGVFNTHLTKEHMPAQETTVGFGANLNRRV